MRDFYQDTIVETDENGDVTALSGVEIEVYYVNTTDLARLYEFPDPTDMRQVVNPITTDATGSVYFYADVGEYDIVIRDPGNRVGLTGFRWNAVNASPGGLPLFMLGEDVRRQITQVGEVIEWWRPVSQVPLPAGFLPCDGRTVPAAEHDFADATGTRLNIPITLPDLRNQFVVGADVLKPDASDNVQGAASAPGDGAAGWNVQHPNAPGIGGTGGKNAAKDLRHTHQYDHTHGVPFIDHTHNGTAPDHLHSAGGLQANSHGHGMNSPANDAINGPNRVGYVKTYADTGPDGDGLHATVVAGSTHVHGVLGSGAVGVAGHAGTVADGAGNPTTLAFTSGSSNSTTGTATNSQSAATSDLGTLTNPGGTPTPSDFRPAHVGLLKLMKVRWA